MDLTKYLVGQVKLSEPERVEFLRRYCPTARDEDWEVQIAGLRVQIIKGDDHRRRRAQVRHRGRTSADGSVAALLGASPGASTAVAIMLDLIARCFPDRWKTPEWQRTLARWMPSRDVSESVSGAAS